MKWSSASEGLCREGRSEREARAPRGARATAKRSRGCGVLRAANGPAGAGAAEAGAGKGAARDGDRVIGAVIMTGRGGGMVWTEKCWRDLFEILAGTCCKFLKETFLSRFLQFLERIVLASVISSFFANRVSITI